MAQSSVAFVSLDDINKDGGPTEVVKCLTSAPEEYLKRGFALWYAIFGDAVVDRFPITGVWPETLTDKVLRMSMPHSAERLGEWFPNLAGALTAWGCRWTIRARSRCLRMTDLSRIDIVNFHDIYSAYVYFTAQGRSERQKCVLTLHADGSSLEDFLSFAPFLGRSGFVEYFTEMERKAVDGCDVLVFPSQGARRDFLKFYSSLDNLADKSVVIPNGKDLLLRLPDQPKPLRREKFPEWKGKKILLCIARLVPDKGVDLAIEALRIVKDEFGDATLVFASGGYDQLKPKLEEMARRLGLGENVEFLGRRTDVPDLLLASDVVVQPSRRDCLPYSVIEAMAAGKPIVATAVGGIPELIEDGATGLLVRPDPGEIAQGIVTLLTDGDLTKKLGQNAREKYLANYTTAAMIDRYLGLFTALVGGG